LHDIEFVLGQGDKKQPHKKFKVDWFGGYIYWYTPRRYAPAVGLKKSDLPTLLLAMFLETTNIFVALLCVCVAAVHNGGDIAPRAASGPGRVLRAQDGSVRRPRCSAWRARLPIIFSGALRRNRPLNNLSTTSQQCLAAERTSAAHFVPSPSVSLVQVSDVNNSLLLQDIAG